MRLINSDGQIVDARQMPARGGSANRNANTNNFRGIGTTGAIVLGILSGVALGASVFSMWQLEKSERETRMLEYYLLELDAKVISLGIKKPDESIAKKLDQEKRK